MRQGVTLDVIGEEGSVAPRDGMAPEMAEGVKEDWTNFTGYFDRLKEKGISMNLISHVVLLSDPPGGEGLYPQPGDAGGTGKDEGAAGALDARRRLGHGAAL